MITVKDLKNDAEVSALIQITATHLEVLGYTEHSTRHASIVSKWAGEILKNLGESEERVHLAEIAGYLHDIGNAVNRHDHAISGAILAYNLLVARGLCHVHSAEIMLAIGNHDEGKGQPVSKISAALIIADKSDVHRSRVRIRNENFSSDIHDRVNYAAEKSHILYENDTIILDITIDTNICPVIDYFEIYFSRMKMCRRAAEFLGKKFSLVINGVQMV